MPLVSVDVTRALHSRVLASATLGFLVLAGACAPPPLSPTRSDDVPSWTVRARTVAEWPLHDGWRVSPVLAAPAGATRVSALARVTPGASIGLSARSLDDDVNSHERGPGSWAPLAVRWRDPTTDGSRVVAVVDLPRATRAVQLRVADADLAELRALTFEAIVPEPVRAPTTVDAPRSPSAATTQAVLSGYEPRSAWGARPAAGCDANPAKTKVTVHHTVSPLNAGGSRDEFMAELRGIQSLHMDGRRYCDVGYHFLVTADGTVWEARDASSLGAHTGSQNTNNLGISFVGCFHPTADCDGLGSTTPPQAMLDGAGAFLGTAIRHYGITLSFGSTFFGHRDNPGQATACPGDRLHDQLDALQAIAEGGSPGPTVTGRVQGTVWNRAITDDVSLADDLGARLPGAIVTATQGDTAVATATARDGDAYWALDLAPGSYTLTATADGFTPATRTIDIAAGDARWSSLGVTPEDASVAVRVVVVDALTTAPLSLATVQFGADDPLISDRDGQVTTSLPPGPITIVVRAEGYVARTEQQTLTAGIPLDLTLALEPEVVAVPVEPPADDDDDDDGDDLQRIVIRNAASPRASGGCACDARTADDALGSFVVLAMVLARLRRRP